MSISTYGSVQYGTDHSTAPIYGIGTSVSGSVSGSISNIQEWVGNLTLTSDIVVSNGAAIILDPTASIQTNGHTIIIQNGGYLNTRNKRLPQGSNINGTLFIA